MTFLSEYIQHSEFHVIFVPVFYILWLHPLASVLSPSATPSHRVLPRVPFMFTWRITQHLPCVSERHRPSEVWKYVSICFDSIIGWKGNLKPNSDMDNKCGIDSNHGTMRRADAQTFRWTLRAGQGVLVTVSFLNTKEWEIEEHVMKDWGHYEGKQFGKKKAKYWKD